MKNGYIGSERRKINRRNGGDRRINPHVNSDPNERKYERRGIKDRRKM